MPSTWFAPAGRSASNVPRKHPAAESAAELMLIAALAEDRLDQSAKDRIARALVEWPLMAGLDWDWVLHRAEALRAEGPLFTESRNRIATYLGRSPQAGSEALELSTRLLAPEVADDAAVILADVGARLGLSRAPGPIEPLEGLARSPFNQPNGLGQGFVECLAESLGPERRMLLFKLFAARATLDEIGPGARVQQMGGWVRAAPSADRLRIDATLVSVEGTFHCRFLAEGEALFPLEASLIGRFLDQFELGQRFLLVHEGELAPPDTASWPTLDPDLASRRQLKAQSFLP